MEIYGIEEHLIARASAGDLRAYAALVKRYEERMYYTAYRILHQRQDAEDCLQETFLRAWDHLQDLKDLRAFRSWLYRVVTNLALDVLRKRERQSQALESFRAEVIRIGPTENLDTPREVLRKAREAERIERAIEDLAPKQKIVFVLRHFQGLSLHEVADILECPIGTVKATLHAALGKLQKNLLGKTRSELKEGQLP